MALSNPRTFNAAFHVRLLVPIEDELLHLALTTIALVWDRHVGRSQEFTVSVARLVKTPTGVDANGAYEHERHHFAFALSSMFGSHEGNVRKGLIIRVAAHEAMHAVQHARGENLDAVPQPGSPDYESSPLEVEAHRESALVLKGYYANLQGPIPLGNGRFFEIPDTSPYTALWEELETRGASVRVLSREATS